jgi:hypothetical protein
MKVSPLSSWRTVKALPRVRKGMLRGGPSIYSAVYDMQPIERASLIKAGVPSAYSLGSQLVCRCLI